MMGTLCTLQLPLQATRSSSSMVLGSVKRFSSSPRGRHTPDPTNLMMALASYKPGASWHPLITCTVEQPMTDCGILGLQPSRNLIVQGLSPLGPVRSLWLTRFQCVAKAGSPVGGLTARNRWWRRDEELVLEWVGATAEMLHACAFVQSHTSCNQ